ncbi:hypothetical protein LTR53_007480, partial [Teratosphaeriaceae sp. CCFEE 6253]
MHSSRLALRQSCSAPNAFRLSHALTSTFATLPPRRQDDAAQKTQHDADKGSFAHYEAISAQFPSDGDAVHTPVWRMSRARSHPRYAGVGARQQTPERRLDGRWPQQSGRAASKAAVKPVPATNVERAALGAPGTPNVSSSSRLDHLPAKPNDRRDDGHRKPLESTPRGVDGFNRTTRPAPSIGRADLAGTEAWARMKFERSAAYAAAKATPNGWKYIMHWVAQWANQLSKDRTMDWTDEAKVTRLRDSMQYRAQSLTAEVPEGTGRPAPAPWALSKEDVVGRSAEEVMEQEIERFATWIAPTPTETAARQAVAQQVQKTIASHMRRQFP